MQWPTEAHADEVGRKQNKHHVYNIQQTIQIK